MGFVDLFRKKWKHSDVEVRASAVRELGPQDTETIIEIARDDADAGVRRIAIKKLSDPAVLNELAAGDPDESLRQLAEEKASAILMSAAIADDPSALEALAQLTTQKSLAEVAKKAASREARAAAVARLTDQRALADTARNAGEPSIRMAALKQVSEPQVLRSIAMTEDRKEVALAAMEQLTDGEALEVVSRKAKNKTVRGQARKKINAMRGDKKEPPKSQRSPRQQLCQSMELLSQSSDWQRAAERVEELKGEWESIEGDPGAEFKERFTKSYDAFYTRYTEYRKERSAREKEEEALRRQLVGRESVIEAVNALSGGSDPARLDELKQQWADLKPLPASHGEVVEKSFDSACEGCIRRFEGYKEQQEQRVLLEDICVQAEGVIDPAKLQRSARSYQALRGEWARLSARLEGIEEQAQRFDRVGEELEQLMVAERARKSQRLQENQERLESLCQRLEEAVETDNLKAAEQLVREAKSAVRQIGRLPSPEVKEELTGRCKAGKEKLFLRILELREAEDWKRWSRVPKLTALCEEVEALAKEEDLKEVGRRLKKAQGAWKKVGPAPRDKSDTLWKRFKESCDKAYERCRESFAKADQDRQQNLEQKTALCDEVEALTGSTEWNETADKIKQIQARWKEIGPVPRSRSDKIWKRFRKACDHFFDRRQQYLDEGSGEQLENLEQKISLCEEVEALVDSTEWDETADKIKRIQARWKRVGPAPRSQSDEIWKRFRKACDRFFDRRQEMLDEERLKNQDLKEALCARLEALVEGEGAQAQDEVAGQVLQARAEWLAAGQAPKKVSHALWERFSGACETLVGRFPEGFEGTELDPAANMNQKQRLCEEAEELLAQVTPPEPPAAPEQGAPEQPAGSTVEVMAQRLREALAENALGDVSSTQAPLDWATVTREVKQLQSVWKKAGPVPGEQGQAVWDRFKRACDRIFELRQGTQPDRPDRRDDNLTRKQELCDKAAALAEDDDPTRHQDEIRTLRRQWKATGPVPKDKARTLWNSFRKACNKVMSTDDATRDEPKVVSTDDATRDEPAPPSEETAPEQMPEGQVAAGDAAEARDGQVPGKEAEEAAAVETGDVDEGAGSQPETMGAAAPGPGPSPGRVITEDIDAGWDDALDAEWDSILDAEDTTK